MLGMSFTEILVILALVLVLFGPDELPKMAKTLGKGLRELRKAGDDLRGTFEQEMVKLDEDPKPEKSSSSLPVMPGLSAMDDPAAARAAARFAALGEVPKPPKAEVLAPRDTDVIKLLPAEGAVAREAVGTWTGAGAPAAEPKPDTSAVEATPAAGTAAAPPPAAAPHADGPATDGASSGKPAAPAHDDRGGPP